MSQISSTINACRRERLPNFDSLLYLACIPELHSEHYPKLCLLYISKLREDGYYRELRIDADVLNIHF